MPIDPTIEAMLAAAPPWPPTRTQSIQQLRDAVRASALAFPVLPHPFASVEDRCIPGPAGDIRVRVYRPEASGSLPLIVYFHGGGYVVGDLDTQDMIARGLAFGAQALLVSVDYRLAPEHPFPAGADDCWAATRWVAANAAALGGDASRLAVAGDSAGANFAAGVCLRAREAGAPAIAAQLLFYGSCDYPSELTPSASEFADGPILSGEDVAYFWEQYLRDPAREQNDPIVSPARAPDLRGLPPAFMATAEIDPTRDHGEAFIAKLAAAGVRTQLVRYPGMVHGFVSWLGLLPAAQEAVDAACSFFEEQCARASEAVPRLPITDTRMLRQALEEANVSTLLMVYVQFTQEADYLERFAPFIRSMFSIEPTNVPDDLAADLRERLFGLLTQAEPPRDKTPPREFVRRMMSVSVGEEVPADQVPVLYDQMAFEPVAPRREVPGRKSPPPGFRVAVIGAGMSGIAAGVKLQEAGYSFEILEKNADFGGTWLENVYPGVAVDTPSHFYSFSFEQNPDWSSYYPKGPEIERYLLGVVEKHGLRSRARFGTRVLGARWNDARKVWAIQVERAGKEEVLEFNAIINGHGVLNRWSLPDIPGLQDFAGPALHSAGWDPTLDLRGKRLALIGTGASGAQLGTATAPLVEHLTVFQRSRHWVMHNPELRHDVTEGIRFALREIPHFKEWFRFRVYWFAGDGLYGNVLRDPEWPHQDYSVSAQNHGAREYALGYLRECLAARPDLLEKITPDYPIFSKRIVLDAQGGWLDTLARSNVTLENRGIDHIEADAIVLEDGTRVPVDVIALATGFEVRPALGRLHVHGRSGQDLAEIWGEDEARSYLGVMVPDYPNLFLTLGPNSAPNHAAGVNMVIEAQINWIIEALDMIVAANARSIEPTEAAYANWNARVEAQMKSMVWTHPKAKSYYLAATGRNWLSSPFPLATYWSLTRHPEASEVTLG